MYNTPASRNTEPPHADRKIYVYHNDYRDVIMRVDKTPGARFRLNEITGDARQPIAYYMGGCVCIQTVRMVAGSPVRDMYYINRDGCVELSTRRGMMLPHGFLDNPQFDITVDQPWESPFCLTPGDVEAVCTPYVAAHTGIGLIKRTETISPLERGYITLETIPSTAHTPVRLPDFGFDTGVAPVIDA